MIAASVLDYLGVIAVLGALALSGAGLIGWGVVR
jgi:hypothetical protein